MRTYLRILLFTSQPVAMSYARAFSSIRQQFIITMLVPRNKQKLYHDVVSLFDDVQSPNVVFSPIFLKSKDEGLVNLLNVGTLFHDLRLIFNVLKLHRPHAVIGMYVIHAYPLVFFKRLLKFSLFTQVSGGDLELHGGVFWRIVRRIVYRDSRIVFTVADRLRREIIDEGGPQASLIPSGADPEYYRPAVDAGIIRKKLGFAADDFIVLTLCFLIERKRVDDVIRAVDRLRNMSASRRVKMVIAGDGPARQKLVELCTDLRLAGDVIFTGLVDKGTKRDLFRIADVYVIASRQEGMPFSLMEAMSCGCICICSNVGDIPRLIEDHKNGFLILPYQPNAIAGRIEEIMNESPQRLLAMRNRARETIMSQFDFRALASEMIDMIQSEMRRLGNRH